MMTYSDVREVNREINAYVEHFTGSPLLVGVDNSEDYRELLDELKKKKAVASLRQMLLNRIEPAAHEWAVQLGNRTGIHGKAEPPVI